jgi:hypothetical protein
MFDLGTCSAESISDTAWLGSLPAQERAVADTAMRLHENFVRRFEFMGGSYLLAFFLKQYLQREIQIESRVVAGFVCAQTTELRVPHAWLEYNGKKVDVALTLSEWPRYQPGGELLILDKPVRPGQARYTYHDDNSAESVRYAAAASLACLEFAITHQHITNEHASLRALAGDDVAMWNYLLQAPPRLSYCAISRAIAR